MTTSITPKPVFSGLGVPSFSGSQQVSELVKSTNQAGLLNHIHGQEATGWLKIPATMLAAMQLLLNIVFRILVAITSLGSLARTAQV